MDQSELLGRLVRKAWMEWAEKQPDIAEHPNWLTPWEGLSDREKEVDILIGEAVYKAAISDMFSILNGDIIRPEKIHSRY